MNDDVKKNKILLYIGLPVLGIVVAIILIVVLIPHNDALLVASVAPADSTITIDGHNYRNGFLRNLPPGHYTATISREGFTSKEVELDLENGVIKRLNEYLIQDDKGFEYYESDMESLLSLREYAESNEDAEVKAFLEEYDRKKSIKDLLPIKYTEEFDGEYYEVTYLDDDPYCTRNYCLGIRTSSDRYTDLMITALKAHGFNYDDYEVVDYSDGCD